VLPGEYSVEIFFTGSDPMEDDPIMSLDAMLEAGSKVDLIATLGAGKTPTLRAVVR
jgi:hypothetical protein